MYWNSLGKNVTILSILLVLSGCTALKLLTSTSLQKPEFKYVSYDMGKPELTKVMAKVNINAYNPNTIGLRNVYVSYELFTQGTRFLKGSDIELQLAPSEDTPIVIPAEIIYLDVFKAVGAVAEKVMRRNKSIPVTARIHIYGKPTIYNEVEAGDLFSFSYTKDITLDVPIPHDEIDKAVDKAADKVKKKLKKLF
jgi:hypothetical protein